MSGDGSLTFLDKPWWPRARQLSEGQSFSLDLNRDGRPDTIIERRAGNIIQAIDDTAQASDIMNQVDTAYLISYGGTGMVDRMVAYIDNDGDGKADEVEIRYYEDGYLRYAWFGENYDHDGIPILGLTNWQLSENPYLSKFRGNGMAYLNKYFPNTRSWIPLYECPFIFWDPNQDGLAEIVLRVIAAPAEGADVWDFDYIDKNKYTFQVGAPLLRHIAITNLRLSYSLDAEPRRNNANDPHFTFGFTMVGQAPYQTPAMFYTNPRRRPPQTVVRLPRDQALKIAFNFASKETGFSWDEAGEVDRWEGQFWVHERRPLPNTGGPAHRWNIRREYALAPSVSRQIYYSSIDKRYHLFGATEGWLEVGRHIIRNEYNKDMEIRTYDSNHDGYFDTWEIFLGDIPIPVRTTSALDPKAVIMPLTRDSLLIEYNKTILPQAIAEDQHLISVMEQFISSSLAKRYQEKAERAASAEQKRYFLDVARELYFLEVRDALQARNMEGYYPRRTHMTRTRDASPRRFLWRYTPGDSVEFWSRAQQIHTFVEHYGNGEFEAAAADLQQIEIGTLEGKTTIRIIQFVSVLVASLVSLGLLYWVCKRARRAASDTDRQASSSRKRVRG